MSMEHHHAFSSVNRHTPLFQWAICSIRILSMVLEYVPTFASTKSTSHVQGGAPKIANLVYNSNNYGFCWWYIYSL